MDKILFDAHSHLNDEEYTETERAAVVSAIGESPLWGIIDVGYDLATSALAAAHSEMYPWCFATVGLLPVDGGRDYDSGGDDALAEIARLSKGPKVMAIGEIGLEYSKGCNGQGTDDADKARQAGQFRAQLALARELGMPVVIHDMNAHEDTMRILKEERAFDVAGVMIHCYSGHVEQALEYVSLGAMISVAGQITWDGNKKLARVAAQVPMESLLIETDAPFLAPEPHRGEKNMSPYVEYTARKLAEIRGMSYEEVAAVTRTNTCRFFGI